jgi:hypothetical protein
MDTSRSLASSPAAQLSPGRSGNVLVVDEIGYQATVIVHLAAAMGVSVLVDELPRSITIISGRRHWCNPSELPDRSGQATRIMNVEQVTASEMGTGRQPIGPNTCTLIALGETLQ